MLTAAFCTERESSTMGELVNDGQWLGRGGFEPQDKLLFKYQTFTVILPIYVKKKSGGEWDSKSQSFD